MKTLAIIEVKETLHFKNLSKWSDNKLKLQDSGQVEETNWK